MNKNGARYYSKVLPKFSKLVEMDPLFKVLEYGYLVKMSILNLEKKKHLHWVKFYLFLVSMTINPNKN